MELAVGCGRASTRAAPEPACYGPQRSCYGPAEFCGNTPGCWFDFNSVTSSDPYDGYCTGTAQQCDEWFTQEGCEEDSDCDWGVDDGSGDSCPTELDACETCTDSGLYFWCATTRSCLMDNPYNQPALSACPAVIRSSDEC